MSGLASESDAALILLATSGTPAAFGVLYRRHRDRVFHHALMRLTHKEDAEDVTAITFLEAWRRRKDIFLHDGTALPWLLTTTNYVILNHRRSARRYRRILETLPQPRHFEDHAPQVLRRLEDRTERERVQAAFAHLRLSDQDILTLCVVEELTTAQAAAVLKVPEGTIKSRLSRAKQRLRAVLSTMTHDEIQLTAPGAEEVPANP